MPQFIYKLELARPDMLVEGPTEREREALRQHFAYLERLVGEGVVLLAGRTQTTGPETFGIVIFEAESESSARETMNGDPVVKAGVMRARVYPYRIAVAGDVSAASEA